MDLAGDWNRGGRPESASKLSPALASRQFKQRERVTPRLGDDAFYDAFVEGVSSVRRVEQGAGVGLGEPSQTQVRDAGEDLGNCAGREQERDPLRADAARAMAKTCADS